MAWQLYNSEFPLADDATNYLTTGADWDNYGSPQGYPWGYDAMDDPAASDHIYTGQNGAAVEIDRLQPKVITIQGVVMDNGSFTADHFCDKIQAMKRSLASFTFKSPDETAGISVKIMSFREPQNARRNVSKGRIHREYVLILKETN